MKFKTFILTFLMMMSCSISFGQGSSTGSATTEAQLWMHLNDDEIGTISLANDIKITATCPIPNGKKVTIDLNGHKLFTEEEIYIINNEGKLTITDNSEGKTGTISSTLGIYNGVTPTRTSVTDVKYDRVLTINGGVFNSSSTNGNAATIYNYRGVIKINGGEFYGEHSAITNYGMATIANAYIECLNRDNGAAAIINDYEIAYGENVNIVGIYTTVTETAYTTGTEPTYLFAELNGTKYPSLQAALDACTTGNNTINLLFHNSDNATVSQKEGVNITIDGDGYKGKQFEYSGTITVDGKSAAYATAGLTIEDVKFNANNITKDASINLGGNNSIRYTSNVTVKNCTFEGVDKAKVAIKNYTGGCKNLVVKNCEATGLHSLVQVKGIVGVTVEDVKVTDCKNGISVGTSDDVAIKGADIEAEGYGLRADGSGEYSLNVENSTLSAEVPVIVRETTGEYDLTVAEDVTLTATNGGPQVVVTAGDDDEPYVAPTVKVNVTLNNDASTFGLVAKIGNTYYSTLDEAFAVATEDQTIVLLADATPVLTSQRAITKAAVIDLNDKTLTLAEDDLYFGTTTFKNGNIVVDPSVKASTAVFWMFENQTLTFDKVNITATGVTGTYLIGINGGTGSNVNLLNGTNIIIDNESQAALSAVICDNGTGNNVIIKDSYINVNKIEGRFYLGGTSGNITVDNTDIDLNGVKEGFYLRANQTLSIEGESEVEVVLNDTNNRYGINITDYSATYTKDDLATVNATVYDPVVRVKNLTELQTALVENVDKPIFATETIVISEGTLELDLNTRRVFAADKNVIRNDGATLTIKNGTIERVGDVVGYAFNNAQGALNITGTTIKGGLYTSGTSLVATNANISHFQSTRHTIYAYNCNVTLNGGTYHNDNSGNATIMAAGSSVVTIKDGTFSIKDGRQELGWTSCLTDTQNTASITVEGGTFNGGFRVQSGTTMTIEGGSFNDCYGSSYNIYGTAVVKGGTFTDANAINFAKGNLAEGYVASDNGNGTFTVLKGVAKIGDTYYATLQAAIDAAEDGTTTINILADITGDVTILQQEGINIVIDGKKNDTENYTFNGTINIYGNARHTGEETLTIQNVNFYTEDNARYFIEANEIGQIPGTNNFKQYAHNVTVENCNFATSAENTNNEVVGMRFRQAYNVSAVNCTSDGIFSIMWTTAVDGLTLNGVEATNCEEGITIDGASKEVEIIGTTINSETYAIRAGGAGSDFIIENSTLVAKVPVVVRNVTDNSMISFTFDGTNTITKDNPAGYWFVAGAGAAYQGNENEQLPETAGQVSVTLNDTGLDREGIYGSALNGEGTEENPYLIETVNDLVFFRDRVNGGNNYVGKHVKLAADIDLSSIENWTPIGDITYDNKYKPADGTKVFSGVFNGNDKVISNLKIEKIIDENPDTDANVGLFGITGDGAVIKNLTLTNVDIKTSGRNVGALAGFAYKATLDNITVNGDIKIEGGHNVSGVAGMTRYHAMSATNIKVVGNDRSTIVGKNIVGGIFAEIAPNGSEQTFKNLSVENVAITGASGVGGIVGLLTLGTVEDVTVKNVALKGNTLYQGNAMGRIRLGSVAGLMGSTHATIANVTTENVTAKNLEGTEIEDLPIIGANYGAASNATEAKIGDTYYATLQTAINAVQDGETVTLVNDITYTDYVYASGKTTAVNIANGKNFTLNLNGKSITGTNATENNYELVTIAKGTKLTIEDSSADKTGKISYTGTRETNDGWMHRCHTIFNQGTLVLNGGTIENNTPATAEAVASAIDNNASWGNEGYLTVNGGTVISTSYYAVRTDVNTHNTTTNGTMVAKVELNGGTIYGYYLMDRGNDLSKLNDIDFTVNENAVIEACEYNGQALRFRVNAKSEYEIIISDEAIINGTVKGLAANIGNSYFATLQDAVDNVKEGNNTINLLADVNENVTVSQVEGINIVIDGKNYQFDGTIYIEGNSRYTGEETLTIQNVNFYTEKPDHDFIASDFRLEECVNPDEVIRYAHNVTVKDCNFATSETNVNNTVVGLRLRQAYNIVVERCTSNYIFSLMWSAAVDGLALNNVTVENCTEGITISGASKDVTITGSNITSPSFGIRASVEGGQFTMTNSTIDALVPVVVRNDNNITDLAQYTLSFTFNGTNYIAENNPTDYWFVAGETEYKGTSEEMPTAPAGTVIVTLNDNNLSYDGVYGNFAVAKIGDVQYLTFEAALNAVKDGETIELFNITGSENKELDFTEEIEFTITGTAPNYALPIVTFQNAIVNISNAEILIPELDARQNATINVINSTVYDAGGNGIVKSYYNGAINIDANSTVYTMQVTTMGYITVAGTLNATWQTNVYGNGLITLDKGATFATAGLNLIAKDYNDRDNTDADRVGKPAEIVVDSANFTVGKVYSASGADYSYNADGYGINVGTIEGKSAILTIKNGGNVNIYTGDGKTANIGADGTVNIDASTFNVECRAENGTATLANNGTVNVTGEASINIKKLTGNAINFTDVTIADAYIGGGVNAFGTNNFSGETNVTGILSLGYETYPTEQVIVNVTGNFNGTNVIIKTNNNVDNILNVGSAEGARTIAYFGQLGAFADVNIVNSDVTYHYAFVRNDFNVTNSTMAITHANTYFSGNAKVVVDNSSWNLSGYANIGSYGGYMYGKADITLRNTSVMSGTKLGIEVSGDYEVKVTIEDDSRLEATELTNQGSIVLANVEAKVISNELTGTDNVPTTTVADHKVVYENGVYKVVEKVYVAQIDNGDKFETLIEAVAAVEDGGTITLIANETFTENNRYNNGGWWDGLGYSGDKSFTIDLANFIISQDGALNDYLMWFKNDGAKDNTITLKNGTLNAGTTAYCALATSSSNTNKMTINTEDINFVGNNSDGAVLKIRGGAELNVKAGTKITGEDSYLGIECYGATVNIYDGAEIYQNGTTSYNGCLVGVGGNGTINVYGGKGTGVSGGFIAMTSGGTINVYDGEWIANTDGTYANSNKSVLVAQNDKQTYAGAGNSIVNVSGGVFKGGYNCYGNAEGDAQINISGGIFSVNPSIYCADNYGAFPYDETSWVVREISGEQTFELTAGWNWVSSYISKFDTDGLTWLKEDLSEQVGAQIKNNLHAVTNYEQGWFGSLTNVSVKEMYKVKATADTTFTHEGSYVNYDECEIVLYPGWNYISYPVNEEMNLIDALAKLQPSSNDIIKRQGATATYVFGAWRGDLTTLTPGQGYMYKNASDEIKSFYYTTKKTTSTDSNNRSSKYWTVDATQYPSNMTMIAMTDVEGGDYEVAAFVNGELRGSSRPVYVEELDAHILILTISGDEVAEVTFKYYDIATGEEVAFSNRINYSSDAVVGSIAEPYMLTRGTTGIGEAEMSQVNIYPNPTTTGKEINLQATCDKVEVFNALGAKVAEYQNVDTIDALETAGIYVIRITNNCNVQNCRLVVK